MSGLTYGSLFSGIGGLDLAVESVFGATCAWQSEVDPNPSKVLAHHWPDTPNLGDITEIDWADVEPVDIICGGFPCQDISSAGRGAGIKEGTRSGLWYRYADAVRVLRPRFVLVENVSALLVRGLDIVIGDLASLGYVGSWLRLHASDVGAPHKRARIFLLAWPASSDPRRLVLDALRYAEVERAQRERPAGLAARPSEGTTPYADDSGRRGRASRDEPAVGGRNGVPAVGGEGVRVAAGGVGPAAVPVGPLLPTPKASNNGNQSSDWANGPNLGEAVRSLLPTPRSSDTNGAGVHGDGGLDLRTAVTFLPTPRARDYKGPGYGDDLPATAEAMPGPDWGPYEPAIRRWEAITRPAPAPTDDKGRLAPELPEWMMGYPAGWITAHLGRSAALRAAGNGVVPQQAAAASRALLERMASALEAVS